LRERKREWIQTIFSTKVRMSYFEKEKKNRRLLMKINLKRKKKRKKERGGRKNKNCACFKEINDVLSILLLIFFSL